MRKLLYIISLFLVAACVNDPLEGVNTLLTGDPKVEIDFTVQVQDPSVATKALGQQPTLRNLMVAVFDASGYLLEYTFATEITLATENTTHYDYKVALTQSDEPRIIHFIGNAPDKLAFGVEETVLADITSSIGKYVDDGIYWCRREVPKISGTQSGADGDELSPNTPIYQADLQTRAYFDNVGLIRNFSQIQLVSSTSDFTLEKYYVVGTPKEGLAAAYNYSTGQFVNYYKGTTISDSEDTGYTFNLGDAKTFTEIIAEGYNANVLPTAPRFTLAEYASNWINNGASAYIYECEKPLRAEDAVYIIAYGTYNKDSKEYYYKIDLRDENGYFPIIRNFKYTVDIETVTRPGYDSVEKAAASAGSGDISTSLETMSLAYISDGVASLEVEYIEKYIVDPGNVPLGYKFLDDVKTSNAGDPAKMWVVVNEAGATGAAIAAINGNSYTVGQSISVSQNPGTLTITPTALTDVPKSQTLTIFAEYTNGDASHVLQRTVNFIVQSKRTMVVSLNPSEVPAEAGSEFDVNISLPAGLSESIFPLEFLIESGSLSINPHNDHMPVRSGFSLVDNTKSSFYFVKTFEYEDYNPESGAINIVDCHFKTIKDQAATHIYAANPYFNTVYDYQGTVSDLDADGESVYLATYSPSKFSSLSFSSDPVGVFAKVPVEFTFKMERTPEDGVVYVAFENLMPTSEETQLRYYGTNENNKAVYTFRPQNNNLNATFKLETADDYGDLSVELSAYKFMSASKSVGRHTYQFNGAFSKPSLSGTAEQVSYTFSVPYYYEGMVIEVELKGLEFNDGKLPTDWEENWRDLGNDVYAVQYKPSGFLNAVTMNLVTDLDDISESCSITVQSAGYETETKSISATQTIPAGKLITNAARNNAFANNGTIYLYTTSNYSDTPVGYRYRRSTYTEGTGWNADEYSNGTATNTDDITLSGVNAESTIYIQYVNGNRTWRGSFKLSDALDNNGANITLSQQ